MKMILVLILMMSSPAFARDKYTSLDGRPMMRETYAAVWKHNILDMFADAGPTEVRLSRNTLYIFNHNCNVPEVRDVLAQTFSRPDIKKKLKDIDMRVECVSNTVTVAANP